MTAANSAIRESHLRTLGSQSVDLGLSGELPVRSATAWSRTSSGSPELLILVGTPAGALGPDSTGRLSLVGTAFAAMATMVVESTDTAESPRGGGDQSQIVNAFRVPLEEPTTNLRVVVRDQHRRGHGAARAFGSLGAPAPPRGMSDVLILLPDGLPNLRRYGSDFSSIAGRRLWVGVRDLLRDLRNRGRAVHALGSPQARGRRNTFPDFRQR